MKLNVGGVGDLDNQSFCEISFRVIFLVSELLSVTRFVTFFN